MKEVYHFSPSACSFFPESIKDMYLGAGAWPSDAYPVDALVYDLYKDPPSGRVLSSLDGKPCWDFIDEPQNMEEVIHSQKKRAMRIVDSVRREIDLLTYAGDVEGFSDHISDQILSLKRYALEVSRLRFEDKYNPHKVVWPKHPLKG